MITVPTVNNNGNTQQSLIDEATNIHNALKHALKLIAESDLAHGRNYQTAGPHAHLTARVEVLQDCIVIRRLSDEYYKLALAIQTQK